MTYECFICGRIFVTPVWPVGWEKDSRGRDRCPKHRETDKPLATLGELILAKQGKTTAQ